MKTKTQNLGKACRPEHKHRFCPPLWALLLAAISLGLASADGADLTWNNGAGTGNWNTTDANWSGSVWNNSTPDNAIFNNLNATVTLTTAITGGSLTYNNGGDPSGAHELILTGSNLSLGSILSWGGYNPTGGGGGVDNISQAYSQRLRLQNITVTTSGNATARRGMLYLNGATLNVSGVINDTDAWSVFRADNSTVTATGGIDFSIVASQVELYGGTVTTPFVKVGNAAFNGTGGLTMGSGVTLVPSGGSTDYIQVFNNGTVSSRDPATISSGGMTINTAYAVTNATVLNGAGGFTKTGNGPLTMTAANTYTGNTVISNGTLLVNGSLGGTAVTVWGGALGGTGPFGGAVTVKAGAKLLAGTDGAYGTNTLSSTLTMETGAICTLDVGTVYNDTNDQVNVAGAVQLFSTAFHLKAPSTSDNLDTTADYVLMTGSSITGTPTLVWDVQPANASQFRVANTGAQVVLQYVPNFFVTYDANSGFNAPLDPNTYSSGQLATILDIGSMSKPGYVCTNWNTAADGSGANYNPGDTLTVLSNTTLYAQWHLGQFTATYQAGANGTITGTASQTVNYGTSTTPVTAVPDAGYVFGGWSDGVLTTTRSDVNFSSNLTVTASFITPLLVTDNFNTPPASGQDNGSYFNANIATDQSGSLAPVSYTVTPLDWRVQHSVGGKMLLAGTSGDCYASLNHNFAVEANAANQPLKLQFDLTIDNATDPNNWTTFAIGSAQNAFVNNAANKFSSLFRQNGGTQQFASGSFIGDSPTWTASGSTITVILSDTAGTGSAFNGNGSVARLFVNGTLAVTYTLAQLGSGDGYISFEANGAWAYYDNLAISVTPIHTVTYAGNGSDSGTAPTDGSSPYVSGSTVTVLGNTGGLAKTGENFGGWNTAANGSGTTFSPGSTFTVTSNTVLYARWVSGYTVIYNGNGNTAGSPPVDTNAYSAGATATVLGSNTLVKTGYVLATWNTAANGSGSGYNLGSTMTVNSNTTLYAQWSPGQFTATYLAGANGAISGTATQTVAYGTSTTPVTAVPDAGYRFASWSDGVLTATRSDINFSSNLTVTASFDNNLVWNNAAGTFAWNETETNWSGSLWRSSIPDNAVFNNGSNTVSLTQAITGGSLTANFGGVSSGTHNLVLSGSSLSLTNILVWGGYNPAAGGGGVDSIAQANNQRLSLSNVTVSVTGNVTVTRGSFMAEGSSVLNAAGIASADAWCVFLMQDSPVVTATNGVDFSTTACAAYLNGGTLTTPFVKVKNAAFNGTGGLSLDGGVTLVPTADTGDFLQVLNSGNNLPVQPATIGSGGLIVDSAYAVTIANPLNGTGGLTKKGVGTLTLTAPYAGPTYGNLYPGNTYAGKTVVQGGVLSIGSTYALPGGAVDITNGAVMDLNYGGSIQVGGLTLNGVTQPNGTYGSSLSTATFTNDTYFTGTGVLNVYSLANQEMTWTGATDNNWDESTVNWTNSLPANQWLNNSAAPNSALFDATGLGQPNVNVALTTTFFASNVTFNAAGYTITNELTLGNTPNFVANSDATIGSLLKGSGGLTKTGNGTLTLSGSTSGTANSYSGATTVNAGVLAMAAGTAWILHGDSAVTVNSGATLQGNDSLANQLNGLTLNGGTVSATGSGNGDWGNFYLTGDVSASGTSSLNADIALRAASVTFGVVGSGTLNVGGVLHNGAYYGIYSGSPANVIKSGTGTLVLTATNTYTGATTVSAGTLAGSGTIAGPVTVQAGGTLAAGAALNGIGTLTMSGNLTLNGSVLVNLDKSQAQSNSVFVVGGVLTNANGAATTLIVSNLGPVLVAGDKFTVFSKAVADGAAVTIVPPAGYTLVNNLAVDGSISVTPATAPTLSVAQSGGNLTFTWTGSGSLEWQTNSLNNGLSTNWVAYPNGTNGVTVPVDTTQGSVFFRVKQ